MTRLRSPSLFWTFTGFFLLVLVLTTVLQSVAIVAVVHPLMAHNQASSAELTTIAAASEIVDLHGEFEGEELRAQIHELMRGIRRHEVPGVLIYRDRGGWEAGSFGRRRGAGPGPGPQPPFDGMRRPRGDRLHQELASTDVVVEGETVGTVVALGARPSLRVWPRALHGLLFLPVSMLVAGGAALVMFRMLMRRIHALERHAECVSGGDLSARVANTGRDEIGRLGTALNEMTARLEEARKTLDASDEQRRRLFADISHELATPLTSIRGYAETLSNEDLDLSEAEVTRYLEHVEAEAARMAALLDELLELTRLEAGSVELVRDRLDLAALCRNTLDRFQAHASRHGLRLQGDGVDAQLWLEADGRRLEQVVDNLLGNALRYVPKGGVVLLRVGEQAGLAVVAVEDDGPGFPAEALPHVFDRFYRADPARSTDGTGLGLAIVREIVRRHGGDAHAENRPQGGARVWVELPLAE